MMQTARGTSADDQLDLSTYAGYGLSSRGNWELLGLDGDDTLYALLIRSFEVHSLNGGTGDDYFGISFLDNAINAGVGIYGDQGVDSAFYAGTLPKITNVSLDDTVVIVELESDRTILISATTEYISYLNGSTTEYYLVEDLARGEIRNVEWDEIYFRAYQHPDSWIQGINTRDLYLRSQQPASTSSLRDSLLVNSYLYENLRSYLQGSETVTYYIHDQDTTEIIDNYSSDTFHHGAQEEAAIENIFNSLDPLIDLDFKRVYDNSQSAIDIYCVDNIGTGDEFVIGLTSPQYGWYDVQWQEQSGDDDLNYMEQVTIAHELGHALGLSHPSNYPEDPRYSTADTIMSYNTNYSSPSPGLTATDLLALQSIWGLENDSTVATKPSANSSSALVNIEPSGSQAIDKIINFTQGRDKLSISGSLLGGTADFKSVYSSKQLIKSQRSSTKLIYFQPRGELYCNDNSRAKGWGSTGLIAVIDGSPYLQATDILLV